MVALCLHRTLLWLAITAVMTAGGCGSRHPPLGSVNGTVRYNGQPIAEGQILFEVVGARPAQGTIIDGRIVDVTSYAAGDGAAIGRARIAVFATPASVSLYTQGQGGPGAPTTGAAPPPGGTSLIPVKYNDPETSGLSHEIVPGVNTLAIELQD